MNGIRYIHRDVHVSYSLYCVVIVCHRNTLHLIDLDCLYIRYCYATHYIRLVFLSKYIELEAVAIHHWYLVLSCYTLRRLFGCLNFCVVSLVDYFSKSSMVLLKYGLPLNDTSQTTLTRQSRSRVSAR